MRLRSLFLFEMRILEKYGFYFLYAVITVVYVIVLFALPENWREKAAAILIFSDPAAMGLFFMGAIVLLEKSQHTPCAVAASPVRPAEYIIAKAGSLSVISILVAAALSLAAGVGHLFWVLSGTFLSGVIFSLLGMIVATKAESLNRFILWTAPVEIACFVPAMLHLFRITPAWLRYYPVNACMDMIAGHAPSGAGLLGILTMMAILTVLAGYDVLKMWDRIGGVKL